MQRHGGFFDVDKIKTEIKALECEMSQPDFWQDREMATQISKKAADLKQEVEEWEKIKKEVDDLLEITQLDKEDQTVNLRKELEKKLDLLEKQFEKLEFFVLMKGKYDRYNVILSIYAGAGGVDAQDWAEMLERMYLRYAEKKGFRVEIIDRTRGGEAGIKSTSLEIQGKHAYGLLKSEDGVHRLVRISPFDAEKMRHTSFAMVQVVPEIEELEEKDIRIEDKDIRIDTFLSSGPGGQGVQTTYSGVRIVHLPTKITATCQTTRSQIQNKEKAMQILKSKLYQYYQTKQEEEQEKLRGEFKEAAWGNQVRSYVLHPYKMVKDHRTNYETSDVEKVLDGDIDDFIEAYLRMKPE